MPKYLSAVPAPAPKDVRLTELQAEIDSRGILNAFGETSNVPVRDLSSEALVAEYGAHFTSQNAQVSAELETLQALRRKFHEGVRAVMASIGEIKT